MPAGGWDRPAIGWNLRAATKRDFEEISRRRSRCGGWRRQVSEPNPSRRRGGSDLSCSLPRAVRAKPFQCQRLRAAFAVGVLSRPCWNFFPPIATKWPPRSGPQARLDQQAGFKRKALRHRLAAAVSIVSECRPVGRRVAWSVILEQSADGQELANNLNWKSDAIANLSASTAHNRTRVG